MTATLLAGDAGCTLMEAHSSCAHDFIAVWPHGPTTAIPLGGMIDLALAVTVLLRPSTTLLVLVCLWKLATEGLFLAAGSPGWEVMERFGSYTSPLALAVLLAHGSRIQGAVAEFTAGQRCRTT